MDQWNTRFAVATGIITLVMSVAGAIAFLIALSSTVQVQKAQVDQLSAIVEDLEDRLIVVENTADTMEAACAQLIMEHRNTALKKHSDPSPDNVRLQEAMLMSLTEAFEMAGCVRFTGGALSSGK